MGPTILRKGYFDRAVFERVGGVSETEAARLVQIVFEEIQAAFVRGESVKIKCFGTFSVFKRKGMMSVRNRQTKKRHQMPGKWEIRFLASDYLKAKLNPGVFVYRWYINDLMKMRKYARSSGTNDASIQGENREHQDDGGAPQDGGGQGS